MYSNYNNMREENIKYIFKTEQELSKEFGENWENRFNTFVIKHLKENNLFGTPVIDVNNGSKSYISISKSNDLSFYIIGDLYRKVSNNDIHTKVNITAWKETYGELKSELYGHIWFEGKLTKNDVIQIIKDRNMIDEIKDTFTASIYIITNVINYYTPITEKVNIVYNDTINNNKMKYIIKTEQELINEFGKNWKYLIKNGWHDKLNLLFGRVIENPEFNTNNDICINSEKGLTFNISKDAYKVEKDIIKDEESDIFFNAHNNTHKVENDVNDKFRYIIKTEQELSTEFGINWKFDPKLYYSMSMDYLIGKELDKVIEVDGNTILYDTIYGQFRFRHYLYKKIKMEEIQEITVKSPEPRYRMKTESDLIKEYGDYWRTKLGYTWNSEMNPLFGKEVEIKKNGTNFLLVTPNKNYYFISDKMFEKMENDVLYFVKTEREFELEFGLEWKTKLSKRWVDGMDSLFGIVLNEKINFDDCHQHRTNDNKYYYLSNDMIKTVVTNEPIKNDTNIINNENHNIPKDTRVVLTVKRENKTYLIHYWLDGKKQYDEVTTILNSNELKYKFIGLYGEDFTYFINSLSFEGKKPLNENFKILYTDSTITSPKGISTTTPNHKVVESKDIDLNKMTDLELSNLKDRIDEILFKREHNFSDDEYEFYLENEDIIEVEKVKSFMSEYKNDKFKIRKNRIRVKLTEMIS